MNYSAFTYSVEFHGFKRNPTPSNSRELENTPSMNLSSFTIQHSSFAAGGKEGLGYGA
jgi:hypothetical protein